MITCSVCGHLNDPARVTCEECGSDLSDSPDWIGYDDDSSDMGDDLNYDDSEDLGYYDDEYYD